MPFLLPFLLLPLYYSIICRRLSHGRKLSLAGEQTGCIPLRGRSRERERERESAGFAVWVQVSSQNHAKSFGQASETWLWARQPNQQAIVAGRTRCYLKSKLATQCSVRPPSLPLSLSRELFTVAIKISAQRRRVKLFNFIKTKRRGALELGPRAEVTPWQRQQTEISQKECGRQRGQGEERWRDGEEE